MKISILSDTHLGFGLGTERGEDSFNVFSEAIAACADSDVILIAGDIFESRTPDAETLTRAMQVLHKTLLTSNEVELAEGIGKEVSALSPVNLSGTPVIAIHGTHERRVKGLLNPVQALENAGFLFYLHNNGVVMRKGDERVCVQGLSGVPDQYAESVLKEWDPKPVQGCFNIFMIHQSISPLLHAKHTLPLEKLPKGFDLYVCGHIHESVQTEYDGAPLLVPGSAIPTQLRPDEYANKQGFEKPKGFWVVQTGKPPKAEWVEFKSQRKVYYREFDAEKADSSAIESAVKEILSKEHALKPLIRLMISGKRKELHLSELAERFSSDAIFSVKTDFEDEETKAADPEEHRLSVQELGRKLLRENLKGSKLDPATFENVFELLESGEHDKALEHLRARKPAKPRSRH